MTATNLVALYPSPPPGYAAYTRQIQVDDIVEGGAVVVKRVTVSVSYSLDGSQPSVSMVTLIAR